MPNETVKYTCCHCEKELPATKYYKSGSGFYSSGHLPICKECFCDKYRLYIGIYSSTKQAMQRLCAAFDVYFEEDIFDSCESKEDSVTVGKYFRKMNMAQYRNKTFDDNIEEGLEFTGDRKKIRKARFALVDEYGREIDEEVKRKDIEKWGAGFEPEDYEVLNAHYKYLKAANPRSDGSQEIFIMDCCRHKMLQLKAMREGNLDDYAKMTDLYTKSYKQGGLKAAGDVGINEEFTIGVTAEMIEKYTPAEYYKNRELYRDFDGIGKYAERHIFRPLKNIIFGTQEKDSEYYVKDEDVGDYDE